MEPDDVLKVWRERERRLREQDQRRERHEVLVGLFLLIAGIIAGILVAKGMK